MFLLILALVSSVFTRDMSEGPVSDFLTCGSPVDAVKTYLYGDPIRAGLCAVYSREDRFNRFREWLDLKGG